MISVGNKEEKSICVWNTYNYTVLDSKSLKFPIFDLKSEKTFMINSITNKTLASISPCKKSPFLYFVSAGIEVVSFWRTDTNNKLEGYHIKIEDLVRDKSEFIAAIEITPFLEKTRTSFVLLGTSTGACLVIEKEKKLLIKKYLISQAPILSINFSLERLVMTSDSPVIYSWMIPFNKIDEDTVFDFLKDTKENKASVIFLDKNIRAVDFTVDGREGLVATENGGVFYVSIKDQTNIKIINSHLNSEINSITAKDKDQLITCSDDGTIRAWTMDSYDQKYEFCYMGTNERCDHVEVNSKEGVALVLFKNIINVNNNESNNILPTNLNNNDVSFNNPFQTNMNLNTSQNQFNPLGIQTFIRVYNMGKLKSLGKLALPENGIFINNFKLIFNGNGIIVTTYQDKVFVIDIQNWDPLSVLYTETNSSYMPKNQLFKHIDSIEVTSHNSICSMSFSNGSIVILNITKVQSKIETEIIDKFNLFEYHMSKSEDLSTAELFKNLTKYRTNYICSGDFSKCWNGVLFCFHECLQFLFLRNFHSKEIYRRIPLNYFPMSLALSTGEYYMSIGTKEGVVLFITRIDSNLNTGFNLDIFRGHFSAIKSLDFSDDRTQLVSASHSEIMVWGIN
jgi:WD40 repeat protein